MIRIEFRKRKTPEISIAPMIDCVLLLLIFFLLTSSFSERLGIEINLPGSDTAAEIEQHVTEIVLTEAGEIMLQGSVIGLQDLQEALKIEVKTHGKNPVFMVADRRVALERVIDVIDKARGAGIEIVSIAVRMKADNRDDSGYEDETE